MGEPLHNIDNVIKAADIMVDDQGLHFSPRKVTVSTSGLVPQLRRFLQESNCTIAVSLNATTDEVIIISLLLLVGTEVVMNRQRIGHTEIYYVR
jgi:23S rRNA (adenine2503-C2)-methyltransferase